MIFTRVTLRNYGLFEKADFDLEPKTRADGLRRNIILFGGKNGAGKTTILEAIRICLYGQRARGSRVRRKDYESFLRRRIHRPKDTGKVLHEASVALEFLHVHGGEETRYRVERSWRDTGASIEEDLVVSSSTEETMEFDREHWEEFVRDLIPPGVSQLFFFDGEKIQSLADDNEEGSELAGSIKGLLGLDLTDRLQADLSLYTRRLNEKRRGNSTPETTLHEIEDRLREIDAEVARQRQARASVQTNIAAIRKKLQQLEDRIGKEGGSFARHREELLARRAAIEEKVAQAKGLIKEDCEGLLPFALIPDHCTALAESIRKDRTLRDQQAVRTYLEERLPELCNELGRRIFGASSQAPQHEVLETHVRQTLLPKDSGAEPVHPLADASAQRLLHALTLATQKVPERARALATRLETLTRELSRVEAALQKAPEDDVLRPLLDELRGVSERLVRAQEEVERKDQEIDGLEAQSKNLERQRDRVQEQLANAEGVEERVQLVAKVRKAMHEFSDALRKRKVEELTERFGACFHALARKDDLLHEVEIDPDTFHVTFLDELRRPLPKSELSAGEKQIYAIAMLWALALTSRRPLPFLIDTPLGRLDSDHRATLVREYFPHVAHQVVILSTDTEIDRTFFDELRPYLARAYHLEYDPDTNATHVNDGYFWGTETSERKEVESPAA